LLLPKVSVISQSEGFEEADAVIRRVKYVTEHGVTMGGELRELWKYRQLLISMVRRELRIRYKNSVLGFLWSFINPLVTVLVMTFVFKDLYGIKTPNYSAYVLASYLPFTFFQMALMDSSQSVLGSLPLIKKIYFPREILPLTNVIANFIHLLLAMCMFFAYLAVIYIRDPRSLPFQTDSFFLPVLLLLNFFLVTGFSLIISAMNVFYEDIKYVVGIITYLFFFMCPVMYQVERVYYKLGYSGYHLYMLNPEAVLVNAYRKILLAPEPLDGQAPVGLTWSVMLYAAFFSLFILWYGYKVFNKYKWRFVERV